MRTTKEKLILAKDDYEIIMAHLRQGLSKSTYEPQNADALKQEMKKAKVVANEKVPDNIVKLNSIVRIRETGSEKTRELQLVTPDKADIKENKISILSPIGTALIGFGEGKEIEWNVPGGKKTFQILEVTNLVKKTAV